MTFWFVPEDAWRTRPVRGGVRVDVLGEARRRARQLGIAIVGQTLTGLIRTIQEREGSPPCFGTGRARCPHVQCLWRSCCLGHSTPVEPWDPFD
ncbi:MAG: hypothetical protein H6834_11060 [Planctomycetes bacterium]|nr:hypothetical protein [Planctomycetota bacterium]